MAASYARARPGGVVGGAERELLHALAGAETLPPALERQLIDAADGNPFYLEELVRSLVDAGALVRAAGGLHFDHEIPIVIPGSVEKVILARIDRLEPDARELLLAASVLGRRFTLSLLEGLVPQADAATALRTLQRLDLVREARRWPELEYRFKHALIQEAAYRTLVGPRRLELHRAAAEWLEQQREDARDPDLLAHHWLAAEDEEKAISYLTAAGDRARERWSLDEAVGHYRALLPLLERRGERQSIALVLFKLALALHTDLRFAEANEVYQRAFTYWSPPASSGSADATLRIGPTAVPNEADPPRSYALQNIQLQMALFDRLVERWPEATIVPSLAARWEISDDGLHYLFHLRDGLQWSDGVPLTAHDVEFGVKRNIDPDRPSPSVGIFLVLEGARDYFLRRHADLGRVGVRALDDKTVEFRLTAPAPYFMSVVNRPDAGPQPRHAIERHGDGWLAPDHQVVSGAFRLEEMSAQRVTLARRENAAPRGGNVRKVIWQALAPEEVVPSHLEGRIDIAWPAIWVAASKGAPDIPPDEIHLGPPAFLYALAFDFTDATVASTDFRRALAHAIDRDMLARMAPASLIVATGGIVPPMLQGHTPEIAPAHDPDLARRLFDRSGATGGIRVATVAGTLAPVIEAVAATWQNVLGARFEAVIVDPAEWRRAAGEHRELAPAFTFGWFPGYPDPEYFLRLLLHSDATDISSAPEARYSSGAFDELIDRAIHERDGARRLELFHAADRLAGAEEVGLIPLFYGQSAYFVKPWLQGWWEFGKSWASFGDLVISPERSATASASVP